MEKLELKHVAPYLPYGLRFIYCDSPEERYILELKSCAEDYVTCPDTDYSYNDIKPILRPLSDLTKEITDKFNRKFVFIDTLEIGEDDNGTEYTHGNVKIINELKNISKHNLFLDVHYLPFSLVQDLLKNHFDIYGLIKKGLAVDINTI